MGGARARASAVLEVALGLRVALVDVLARSGLAEDTATRQLLVQSINGYLPHPLTIADQMIGRNHLIEIVNACAEYDGGLDALEQAVWLIRPGSLLHERIRRLVQDSQVRDLLPASEIDLLRQWLGTVAVPQLPTLVRRAAGLAPVPTEVGSAWDAIGVLADLNVAPDGFPPIMLFVELVACQLGGLTGEHLMRWNDDQARRLGLEAVLRARRAKMVQVPQGATLHLLIVVQPDGINEDRCLVSHWRQDDPEEWPPAPAGDTAAITINELAEHVDELVVAAERAWSGHGGAAALEIVLPRALLNLPVHRWYKERRTGNPRPLCLDYPIVVRSLERMRSPYWHRAWRRRWCSMVEDPSPARVHFARPADIDEPYRIDAILSDPRWLLLALAAPPAAQPLPGTDEFTAALQAGLPGLVWHPVSTPDELREVVAALVQDRDLIDLPARLQARRQSEFLQSGAAENVRDLILLWDDPNRLVLLDQSYGQRPRGDSTDERETAS